VLQVSAGNHAPLTTAAEGNPGHSISPRINDQLPFDQTHKTRFFCEVAVKRRGCDGFITHACSKGTFQNRAAQFLSIFPLFAENGG